MTADPKDDPERGSRGGSTHDPTRDGLGEPGDAPPPDPMRAARAQGRPSLPKRFYAQAGFAETEGGFALTLDGRTAKTPARKPLAVPNARLAERLATEWASQETVIDPARMPLTRLVNSAIDGVADRRAEVAEDLAAYAGTDLVAYRASEPERLVTAQAAAWDPVIDWAREALGARLILSEEVMHVDQPDTSIAALRAAIDRIDSPFTLAALHAMTTLTGSLLIGLAVVNGRLTADEAWEAAHVDETFQASVWGRDEEAEERLAKRREDFEAAATLATLA